MPSHYTYQDPKTDTLSQGDILARTKSLGKLVDSLHPEHKSQTDCKFYVVLTQSCDLVLRNQDFPKTAYVTLAPVVPVDTALKDEARKYQKLWMEKSAVLESGHYDKIRMFTESLMDNNRQNYFYLHEDAQIGLSECSCALLAFPLAIPGSHYDLCIQAKIGELEGTFQAKLGWLVGNIYSRVGTSDWNDHYKEHTLDKEVKGLLRKTFISFSRDQIRSGEQDLARDKDLSDYDPEVILEYIRQKKVISKAKQFNARALKLVSEFKFVDKVCSALELQMSDRLGKRLSDFVDKKRVELVSELNKAGVSTLKRSIEAVGDQAGSGAEPISKSFGKEWKEAIDKRLLELLEQWASEIQLTLLDIIKVSLSDDKLQGREKIVRQLAGSLQGDSIIKNILT